MVLAVFEESVKEEQHPMPDCSIHYLIDSRQWEAILWVGFIQVRVVHTYSPFS